MKMDLRARESRILVFFSIMAILILLSPNGFAQISSASAKDSLEQSQNIVNFMQSSGLNTNRVNDLLSEARLLFETGKYGEVKGIELEIAALRDKAFALSEALGKMEALIAEAERLGYNASLEQKSLHESKEAYETSNYELSEDILNGAQASLDAFLKSRLDLLWNISGNLKPLAENLGSMQGAMYQESVERMQKNGSFIGISALSDKVILLNQTLHMLSQVNKDIAALRSQGMNIGRLQDQYNEALIALELGFYDKASVQAAQLELLVREALSLRELIDGTQLETAELAKSGLDVAQAQTLLDEAGAEFEQGDFEASEVLVVAVRQRLADAQSSSAFANVFSKKTTAVLIPFLKRYWYLVIAGLAVLIVVGFFSMRFLRRYILAIRIQKLYSEEKTINELMKKDQEQYYKHKTMSKGAFEARSDSHQERLLGIKETLPILEKRLEKMKGKRK